MVESWSSKRRKEALKWRTKKVWFDPKNKKRELKKGSCHGTEKGVMSLPLN
jgi:hypothetical protein